LNALIPNRNLNIQEVTQNIYQCGKHTFHLPEIQKDNGTKFEPFTAQLSTGPVQLISASQDKATEANQVG
jgi:hypothetical protein